MNKFMKISLATAGVLAAVGFVLCLIAGIATGGNLIASVKNDEYMARRLGIIEKVIERIDGGFSISKTGREIYHTQADSGAGSDKLMVNDSYVSSSVANEYHIETEGLRELHLSLGAGNFTISEKDESDNLIDLYVSGKGSVDFFVKGNTLHVEGFKDNHLIGIDAWDNSITMRIPKDMSFDEIELEIGAGIMDICNLKARELDATVGAGELTMEKAELTEFSAEIGAGNLSAGGMYVREADVNVSLGNCSFEGTIEQNLDAECAMGSMEFLLKGKEEDHNYKIECSAGNIWLNGFEFTGLSGEKHVNNGAASTYDLSCSMGNITLDFQGE